MEFTSSGKPIEINERSQQVLDAMERGLGGIFITGRAGTGKSTLLEYFRARTKQRVAVLAPTGVAALNVRGQTIHSFFGFKPNVTLAKVKKIRPGDERGPIVKQLDAIVVDEASMVRADLLDCMDKFLRLNGRERSEPFGGVRMIFVGDLYQLPPVLTTNDRAALSAHYDTPYFFSAAVFKNPSWRLTLIELERVYRQEDPQFIALLNAVRNNTIDEAGIAALNQRLVPPPPERGQEYAVTLTATNAQAAAINETRLNALPGKAVVSQGVVRGEFERGGLPTEAALAFKPGAQIMMLNNDSTGRWVNGTLGQVLGAAMDEDLGPVVNIRLEDGREAAVMRHTWELFRYTFDQGLLDTEIVGTFTQYPFRLAWAVTIHKSQGKTFDRVRIDLGRGTFAHGQLYVALSRCRTFEGITLAVPVQKRHVLTDWRVRDFITRHHYGESERALPLEAKVALIKQAIKEMRELHITYLKSSDVRSERTIKPTAVGEYEYKGKTFLGLKAHCCERCEERTFKVERILRMEMVK